MLAGKRLNDFPYTAKTPGPPMRALLLLSALACGFAHAEEGTTFKLNGRAPQRDEHIVRTKPELASSAPAQKAEQGRKGAVDAPQTSAPAGLPLIPGSLPGASSLPTSPSGDQEASSPGTAISPQLGAVGGPVKAYASMSEAAADGVDPFKKTPLSAGPTLRGRAQDEPKHFNWLDPLSYIQWFQDHPKDAVQYGGAGLLTLVVFAAIRRRGERPA